VYERFTERARRVIVLAQDEARGLRHRNIGPEHILLGLLGEKDGLAAQALDSLNVNAEEVHTQVMLIVGRGEETVEGAIPFTPQSKRILELALREALSLGHNYVGTEHLLLGLIRENEGVATRILLTFDADAKKVRKSVHDLLPRWSYRHQTIEPQPLAEMSSDLHEALATAHEALVAAWQLATSAEDERRASIIDRAADLVSELLHRRVPPDPTTNE
jgi:ATP-dependent Clp protease ATP-binding subunit ClpA